VGVLKRLTRACVETHEFVIVSRANV